MAQKCDYNRCPGFDPRRSDKTGCFICRRYFHLYCAGISPSLIKIVRHYPGIKWHCPDCRNATNVQLQLARTKNLDFVLRYSALILVVISRLIDFLLSLNRPNSSSLSFDASTQDADGVEEKMREISNNFDELFVSILPNYQPQTCGASPKRKQPTVSSMNYAAEVPNDPTLDDIPAAATSNTMEDTGDILHPPDATTVTMATTGDDGTIAGASHTPRTTFSHGTSNTTATIDGTISANYADYAAAGLGYYAAPPNASFVTPSQVPMSAPPLPPNWSNFYPMNHPPYIVYYLPNDV